MFLATPIADSLRRGATVLAANSRAARALHVRYAQDQRNAGREVWPSPPIFEWDSWLRDLWRDYAFRHPEAPILLSPLQERVLWERVQRDDAARVLSPEAMATLAMQAWRLICEYQADSARRSSWEQPDAERFRHWAVEFERLCTGQNWISFSRITAVLATDAALDLPREICLVGFDRTTPAQRAFLTALADRDISIAEAEQPQPIAERCWVRAVDARHEIAACARWARERLSENPAARIGIIVPGVVACRGDIERIFRRTLMPVAEDIRQPAALMPWEFSLGQPLGEVPVIRAAILLLRWIARPLAESEASWILLSGFLSKTASRQHAIARYDAEQRRRALLVPERSLAETAASVARNGELRQLADDLSAVLQSVAANRLLDQERQPSAWTDLVQHLLSKAGWPGERPLSSDEFQATRRWDRLLDDLAQLDFDGSRSSYVDFLDRLENWAGESIFAPESHDAPVQIMGPFESSGQQFDAVWFMGTEDGAWPQHGRLHPLVASAVQREFGMPSATPEDDWKLAHAVTARLLTSASQVVFSYAERDKDAELRPSPLIAGLFSQEAVPVSHADAGDQACALEPIHESGALHWPRERTAGGAEVLKRQSACPFQAFAVKRLSAQPLDCPEWGLSPAEKGKLLHNILERLFSGMIRGYAELEQAFATNQVESLIDAAIEPELARYSAADPWRAAYLDAERRRLRARILEWLAYEAKRLPFTVEHCEQKLADVHVGDLRLNLRADRIDVLADGSRVILDYKSGEVSAAGWKGERPDEPQLPLYAAYGGVENLSGVLLAKIRAGETCIDGRIRDARSQLFPDANRQNGIVQEPYTDAMREEWAQVLARLAAQFQAGDAAVDPREPAVCGMCDLHGLCRVAELNLFAPAHNGEAEDD